MYGVDLAYDAHKGEIAKKKTMYDWCAKCGEDMVECNDCMRLTFNLDKIIVKKPKRYHDQHTQEHLESL